MSTRNTIVVILATFALVPATSNAQIPVPPDPYFTFNYGVKDLSRDGNYVLTSEGMWRLDEKRWVWQTWFGPDYKGVTDDLPVHLARFTPDGKHIVACRQSYGQKHKTNKLWVVESATGMAVRAIETEYTYYASLEVSPDGKHLFTNGGDWRGKPPQWLGCIQVWDLQQGKKVLEFGPGVNASATATPMAISPDGKYLCCGSTKAANVSGILQMWDAVAGKELWQADEHASAIAFAPNGRHVLSAGNFLRIRDIQTGKLVQSLKVGANGDPSTVLSAVLDKDGKHVLVGGGNLHLGDGGAKLWNLESGTVAATFDVGPKKFSLVGPYPKWYLLPDGVQGLRVDASPGSVPARMTFTIANIRDGKLIENWEFPHGLKEVRLK